jgi:hypothetical protein
MVPHSEGVRCTLDGLTARHDGHEVHDGHEEHDEFLENGHRAHRAIVSIVLCRRRPDVL